jgi:hypothetical protein
MGLTDQPIAKALPIAKAWLRPPEVIISGTNFTSDGYNRDDKAYHIRRSSQGKTKLDFTIQASDTSPAVNPAFVIEGWGNDAASLMLNGKTVVQGKDFRIGYLDRLDGTNMVVWIRAELTKPATFSLTAHSNR